MSVESMSGFGSATFEAGGQAFRAELKSVNHRNLNTRFHTPPGFDGAETPANKRLRERLYRGSVHIQVHREAGQSQPISVEVDTDAAKVLLKALVQLASETGAAPPTLDTALRLGDFVRVTSASVAPEVLVAGFLKGLDDALDRLVAMRRVEGARLAADLDARLAILAATLDRIETQAPLVMAGYEARLTTRLADAVKRHGGELEPGRLATELVLFSDRSDVTEEVVRARTHIEHFRTLLAGDDGPQGKRLDFLSQELLREFNTVGSKCRDANMAGAVVDAKVELERIREQVQNIA